MAENSFSFMSTKIKFRDDPKFIHLDDTLRCLAYVFIHHLDIWVQLAQKQMSPDAGRSYAEMGTIDAGRIFNNLLLTQPFSSTFLSQTEMSEKQYESVVNTFVNCVSRHPKLAFHAKAYDDPYECMWEFCHYLFVPVRLQHDSIPRDIRMNSLRKWVNVVFTLPFIKDYTDKYVSIISNISFLQDVFNRLTDDASKIEKFTQIDAEWTYNTIARSYNKDNPTQIFVRLFMNVLVIASVEILKKYCPNYHQCAAVNPDYDGNWLNPFDHQHMDHLQEINKLTALLSTEGA